MPLTAKMSLGRLNTFFRFASKQAMKILIIGGGNMGQTYARSFLRSHIANEKDMMILEKSPEKAVELSKANIGTIYGRPQDCVIKADLIILAVKPQDVPHLFSAIQSMMDPQQVVLSIMAGVQMQSIATGLGLTKIIRAMPNLPAQIGMGMTAFTSSEAVTRIELVMVQNLLNTTGKTVYVEDEAAIDAATAISGSGPAYVWYFMDAIMQAASQMGFNASEAELLVSQTFRGAIDLYSKSNLSFEEWINRVKSRGGTTEAALNAYHQAQLAEKIIQGSQAALHRAQELGN